MNSNVLNLDDEDVADNWEDTVKESWDEEEPAGNWDDEDKEDADPFGAVKVAKDSPKKTTTTASPAATPTKKKIKPKKITKKALQNKLKVTVDPNEEKLRLLKLQKDADLETASDLLSTNTAKTSLSDFKPTTQLEFLKLSSMVVDELGAHEESQHYAEFVKDLTRKLVGSLTADDIQAIVTTLNVVINQKRDEERGNKKKKTVAKKKIDEEFVEEDFIEDDYDYGFLA